jgi:hypothetical protein
MAAAFHQVLQYRRLVASMLLAEFRNELESSIIEVVCGQIAVMSCKTVSPDARRRKARDHP